MKVLTWLLGLLAALFSWDELLWQPVARYLEQLAASHQPFTLGALLLEVLKPNSAIYHGVLLGGYLFLVILLLTLLLTVAMLYAIARRIHIYWDNSTAPFTVLENHLTLDLSAGLSDAVLKRHQYYHANRPGQRLYYMRSSVSSPTGKIPKERISVESILKGQVVTKSVFTWGNERSYELLESYTQNLPTNPIVTFLPNSLVSFLFHQFQWFTGTILERQSSIPNVNEYDGPEGQFSLTALRYPCRVITMTLIFPNSAKPKALDFYVIRENAVETVHPKIDPRGNTVVYEATQRDLVNASLRVFWAY